MGFWKETGRWRADAEHAGTECQLVHVALEGSRSGVSRV